MTESKGYDAQIKAATAEVAKLKQMKKVQSVIDRAPTLSDMDWSDVFAGENVHDALRSWDYDEFLDDSGDANQADELNDFFDYVSRNKKAFDFALDNGM